MNFNQFGMTNSIVSGLEDVGVRIMSILHSHVTRRKWYIFSFLLLEITHSKTVVKRSWKASNALTIEFAMPN